MQVIVTVATVDTPLASGQTLGNWIIDILDEAGTVLQSQPVGAPTATFNLADGTYTAQAKRIDSTGALFGVESKSAPFAVTTPTGQSAGPVTVSIG